MAENLVWDVSTIRYPVLNCTIFKWITLKFQSLATQCWQVVSYIILPSASVWLLLMISHLAVPYEYVYYVLY